MKAVVDSEGRVQIPAELLEEAGLEPGVEVELRYCDGHVVLEKAPQIRLERRDGFLVAVAERPLSPVTDAMVQQTLDDLRDERAAVRQAGVTP